MLTVERPADLQSHAGQVIGSSAWLLVEQHSIDDFARLSGDDNWIHVDVERAKREMPGGKTIAHGLYLLSLIPWLHRQVFAIRQRGRGFNYGYERIRFLTPVPVGSRVRLTMSLVEAAPHAKGTRIETEATIELEGSERPALVARNIVLIEDK